MWDVIHVVPIKHPSTVNELNHLFPSLKPTVCLWKWIVGIRSFPFGMAYFQVQTISFRECVLLPLTNRPGSKKGNRTGLCPFPTSLAPFFSGFLLNFSHSFQAQRPMVAFRKTYKTWQFHPGPSSRKTSTCTTSWWPSTRCSHLRDLKRQIPNGRQPKTPVGNYGLCEGFMWGIMGDFIIIHEWHRLFLGGRIYNHPLKPAISWRGGVYRFH